MGSDSGIYDCNANKLAEDNGWGPGISNLDREDWDWDSASGHSSRGASSSGNDPRPGTRPGAWSRLGTEAAAEGPWNEPGKIFISLLPDTSRVLPKISLTL